MMRLLKRLDYRGIILHPLHKSTTEQLTVKQVVAWFVKDGKIPTEQGVDGAFLDL
jgi:hypothetical protein